MHVLTEQPTSECVVNAIQFCGSWVWRIYYLFIYFIIYLFIHWHALFAVNTTMNPSKTLQCMMYSHALHLVYWTFNFHEYLDFPSSFRKFQQKSFLRVWGMQAIVLLLCCKTHCLVLDWSARCRNFSFTLFYIAIVCNHIHTSIN